MTVKKNLLQEAAEFLKELQDFSRVVDEPCPEGHRKDPASGACLPISGLDHTSFTRSVNVEDGPYWRGEKDKENVTFDSDTALKASEAAKEAALLDARTDMQDLESCGAGLVFSFIQRKCVSVEEAEAEDNDIHAMVSDVEYLLEEGEGHEMVVKNDPEGRRDTVGFECPPKQFFDFKLRECIPLNKDTVLASEQVDADFKATVASHLSGRLAVTSPDPLDGHTHLVTVDEEGNGNTSVCSSYMAMGCAHAHVVKEYEVQDYTSEDGMYTSRHFGYVIPKDVWEYESDSPEASPTYSSTEDAASLVEDAAKISYKQRKGLPSSSFGVPGKRKFPLDTCARVRNAMARFNQSKGLSPAEKSTLRRKIMARAKQCGIEVKKFGSASTAAEFAAIIEELITSVSPAPKIDIATQGEQTMNVTGPCPPGMEWSSVTKSCGKLRGFVAALKNVADSMPHEKDPEGRKDTPGFKCPPGTFFDFKNRQCLPLDPSEKMGTTTTKAEEVAEGQRDLAPSPAGRPARLPEDCPKDTIWDSRLNKCRPLDPKDGAKPARGEVAENREGLTPAPEGKVRLPSDCPTGTLWDGKLKVCKELDSSEKVKPGNTTIDPMQHAEQIENMSLARVIAELDRLIQLEAQDTSIVADKKVTVARDLPDAAFPPSLVSTVRRALMHHSADTQDPYNTATVDIVRLRNALARVDSVDGFSAQAVVDAKAHLLYHAKEILQREKKF